MSEGRRFPSWIFPAVLAALLLYFSIRGVEWRRVGQIISAAYWPYLIVLLCVSPAGGLLRSIRWRILLNSTLLNSSETRVGVVTVFWAVMAGYLGNLVLPARAGELVRTFLISARSGLSKTYVLTTALGERVMDAIALILFSALALLGVQSRPDWMSGVARSLAAVAIASAASVALLPYIHGLIERFLRAIPVPGGLRDKFLGLLEQVILGLRAFHDPKRFAAFAGMTAVIWCADTCGGLLAARALGLPLRFSEVLLFLAALGLGSALPSTPGYLGIYQFVAVTVLAPFGIARDAALAYVIVVQAVSSVVVIVFGALGMIRLGGTLTTHVIDD